jgi:hypothetical protein
VLSLLVSVSVTEQKMVKFLTFPTLSRWKHEQINSHDIVQYENKVYSFCHQGGKNRHKYSASTQLKARHSKKEIHQTKFPVFMVTKWPKAETKGE